MQIKAILFGFGLGLVFLSAVVLQAYRLEASSFNAPISEEEIMYRATELGMLTPEEDITEIVRRALELGMVFEEGN